MSKIIEITSAQVQSFRVFKSKKPDSNYKWGSQRAYMYDGVSPHAKEISLNIPSTPDSDLKNESPKPLLPGHYILDVDSQLHLSPAFGGVFQVESPFTMTLINASQVDEYLKNKASELQMLKNYFADIAAKKVA